MKDCGLEELFEIDRCFQYVSDRIRLDAVNPRSVLFGSTVDNWFKSLRGSRMKIVVAGVLPNDNYESPAYAERRVY